MHFGDRNTLKALAELIAAAGLTYPSQLRPHHIVQRVSRKRRTPALTPAAVPEARRAARRRAHRALSPQGVRDLVAAGHG
jgi:hypothetical protein